MNRKSDIPSALPTFSPTPEITNKNKPVNDKELVEPVSMDGIIVTKRLIFSDVVGNDRFVIWQYN